MPPLATRADLEVRLRTSFDATDGAQADQALKDVSALVRRKRPNIDTWITDGDLDVDIVVATVCQATIRYLSTMDTGGRDVISETVPEHTYMFSKADASGLSLTEAELNTLTIDETAGRAFTVMPGF